MSETSSEEHLAPGNALVIIALEHEPNPGTADGTGWSMPLTGQGVFPVIDADVVLARSDVFPEAFDEGRVTVTALDGE